MESEKKTNMDPSQVSDEDSGDEEEELENTFDPDPSHKPMAYFPKPKIPIKPMKMYPLPKSGQQGQMGQMQMQQMQQKQMKKKQSPFSPISWKNYFDEQIYMDNGTSVYTAGDQGHVFICMHGAGFSGASFALFASEVKKFATVAAFDFRDHGLNKMQDVTNLTSEQLVNDSLTVFDFLFQKYPDRTFIIVGHSLGGAIAAKACKAALEIDKFKEKIKGLVVIDVIEGTAIEALPYMESIEMGRQQQFKTIDSAVKYQIASGMVKNRQSSRVSTPPCLLKKIGQNGQPFWVWRTNRMAHKKFWMGWFKGMNAAFLGAGVPKILMTSEKGRMDKEFIIAQMQGKFRLQMFNRAGHSIQEDDPKGVAKSCYDLLKLFRIPGNNDEIAQFKELGIGKFKPNLPEYP